MMFKVLIALLSILASLSAHAGTLVSFATLFSNPDAYHDQYLTVRGFVGIDSLGHQYLFGTLEEARAKDYPGSIDILPLLDTDAPVPRLRNLSCAELYGAFHSWSNYITTDYLLSKAGGLRVKRVSACPRRAAS